MHLLSVSQLYVSHHSPDWRFPLVDSKPLCATIRQRILEMKPSLQIKGGIYSSLAFVAALLAPTAPAASTDPTSTHTLEQSCPTSEIPCLYHVGASERPGEAHGMAGYLTIEKPKIETRNSSRFEWSDGQLFMANSSTGDVIELGWVVEKNPSGRDGYSHSEDPGEPHLLLGVRTGAREDEAGSFERITRDHDLGGHFHPASDAPVTPNGDISHDLNSSVLFHIGYHSGNKAWWIQYGSKWIGYIDASYWPESRFKSANYLEWYGEVGSYARRFPCIQMGNGTYGSRSGSARMSGLGYEIYNSEGHSISVRASATMRDSDTPNRSREHGWDGIPRPGTGGTRAFFYGGPGYSCSR
ncbi:neprosin family prolyl endopeptidase [Streptomyces torulosus]|uniref:neprosin family prolyl endopeptidase n=1 Tax=Streptomyces torulosus TaxID=68276 RepID=UPI0014708E1B|nr:neprosin family prolyl endopeptidase [Streptomyces torulosus]